MLHEVQIEDPATGYVRIVGRREFWRDYWELDMPHNSDDILN
jgi:hypothetical protein